MGLLREKLRASPIHARVAPYVLLVLLTVVQDEAFKGPGRYWMYLGKMLLGAWCIWQVRDLVTEARWAVSWEAIVVGVGVCVVWVGLDPYYPKNEVFMKAGEA